MRERTLNSEPMTDNMTMANKEMTKLKSLSVSILILISRRLVQRLEGHHIPAPSVQGRYNRLHIGMFFCFCQRRRGAEDCWDGINSLSSFQNDVILLWNELLSIIYQRVS